MIRYRLRHETVYRYGEPVAVSHNLAHLVPRPLAHQRIRAQRLEVRPLATTRARFRDYFGNEAVFFIIEEPHEELRVRASSRIDVDARPPAALDHSEPWEALRSSLSERCDPPGLEAREYVFDSALVRADAALAAYARPSFPPGRPVLEGALDLCRRIHREFRYDPEATSLATPLREVIERRHGVCQDFAHVMIGALRSLGLPARYVSGYLRSRPLAQPGAGPAADGADELVGAEASHAWVSAFSSELGWIDFDPTNDLVPSDRHVVLAWGRDYDDVSPLQGVTLGGGLQTVSVAVELRPVDEGTETDDPLAVTEPEPASR